MEEVFWPCVAFDRMRLLWGLAPLPSPTRQPNPPNLVISVIEYLPPREPPIHQEHGKVSE